MKGFGYGLLALVMAFSLVVSACAAPAKPGPTPTTPAPTSTPPAPVTAPPAPGRELQMIEGAKKEQALDVWVFDMAKNAEILAPFRSKYPFINVRVWDSRGPEIMAKLTEETKAGRHSVDVLILSSEMQDAQEMGLLDEYQFPNVAGWPNQPKHNFFRTIGGTARVVEYNTNLVAPADVPRTWDDVKSTKWAGKTFMSTSAEDSPFFWAYLWREGDKLNWDKSFAFWTEAIKNTKPKVVSGFGGPRERLAAGEVSLMIPDATSGGIRLMMKGAPLAFAPLGAVSGDATAIALVKGAPHPNSARLFIDWLTTDEGALLYSDGTNNLALKPELARKARTNLQFKALGLTWDPLPREIVTSENLKKSSEFWLKALGVR